MEDDGKWCHIQAGATESPAWNFSFACFVHLAAHDEPYTAFSLPKLDYHQESFRYNPFPLRAICLLLTTPLRFSCDSGAGARVQCLIRAQIALLEKEHQTATDALLREMIGILSATYAHTRECIYIYRYIHIKYKIL